MRSSAHRLARAVFAVFTVVASAIVGLPGVAQAGTWSFSDYMEISGGVPPQSRFTFASDGGAGNFVSSVATPETPSKAHSPTRYADLSSGGFYGTWSSVGRTVTISALVANRPVCRFSAYTYSGSQYFNIEVIDPSTWTYVAVKKVRGGNWTWGRMSTDTFIPSTARVFVRVSLLGPSYLALGFVDDFHISCTY